MNEQNKTFEGNMQRLEQIVRAMERGDVALDESLKLFQEGTALVQSCGKLLDKAEHLIHRDLQSHLVTYHKAQHMLMAAFYTLDCFSPSECLGFYHYHLQRTLGTKALVWLATEGGRV